MNFVQVRLKTAALRKTFFALVAFVWFHTYFCKDKLVFFLIKIYRNVVVAQTCMSSNMTFEIKRIIEAFSTVAAFVFFVRIMISTMSVQHTNVFKFLTANIFKEEIKWKSNYRKATFSHFALNSWTEWKIFKLRNILSNRLFLRNESVRFNSIIGSKIDSLEFLTQIWCDSANWS